MLKLPPKGSENFELITVSLHDDPKYAALSYLWGDPEDQEIITVQGHKVKVTKNLAAALSRLRRGQSSLETEYLWADAICIDQTNHAERSQQVQLMGRIYSSAVVVYSWVGPNDYTLAFKTLATLARLVRERAGEKQSPNNATFQLEWLRQHPDLCDAKDEAGGNPWQSVCKLAAEKYWKRIWVFQEVALARRLCLLSSGDTILGLHHGAEQTKFYISESLEIHRRQFSLECAWARKYCKAPSAGATGGTARLLWLGTGPLRYPAESD
ncbi:hypothetical protein CEP53_000377 [Fusarium sp. AF-6]|nr:hypothetical protein CEP53_000377 [Fusarium sp. AF-6]